MSSNKSFATSPEIFGRPCSNIITTSTTTFWNFRIFGKRDFEHVLFTVYDKFKIVILSNSNRIFPKLYIREDKQLEILFSEFSGWFYA